MNKLEFPFTKNLSAHPLNARIYGRTEPDSKLVESISALGILEPLVIDKDRRILSGHRRWAAARQLSLEQVPVIYFKGSSIEAERLIIEANRQRVKNGAVIAKEAHELLRIEVMLAFEREKVGKARATSPKGRARAIVAKQLGIGEHKVEQASAIVTKAEAGDRTALAEMKKLETGETTINAAYKTISPKKVLDTSAIFQTFLAFSQKLQKCAADIESRKPLMKKLSKDERSKIFEALCLAVGSINRAMKG